MQEKLLALLDDVRPDVDFQNEKQLIDDGVLDSFDIISIVQKIEETFGVKIDADELEPNNFNSAEAMLSLIKKLQA